MMGYWSDGLLEPQRSNTPTIQYSSCSDTAYRLGAPDGSISLASLAANIHMRRLAVPIACKLNLGFRWSQR